MTTKHHEPQKHSKDRETKQPKPSQTDKTEKSQNRMREKDEAVRDADEAVKDHKRPDRTAGQNEAVDQKRNDEQQYHAGGAAHDPHNRTQERVDSGDPDAGDVDEETRSDSAPFNKTYGS
jgi:hypothetical protein